MSFPAPQAPAPAAPPVPPAKGNALAVAGFVVALVSLLFCLVPIVNNLALLGAVVGLVLAVVGVVKSRRGAPRGGLAIAGVVLAVLAGIGVLASQAFYGKVVDEVTAELSDTPTAAGDDTDSTDAETDDAAGATDAVADTEPADQVDAAADDDGGAGAADGTREHPYRFSETVSNDDWTVDLGKPYEAWDEVHAENQFNEAPADGTEFWIVPVEATYTGADTGTPWLELTVEFVGDDAVTYSDSCGVVPDDLIDVDELYEGGTGKGNVCVAVPAGAHGTWTLTAGWFSDPVFFATRG
ncbi:hypothetical protein ATJ88_1067 [Isoptericola jiangsuensis]|uniref:DUF4190 domain-containing protein n=1 Tax=Isoptericola jiangsuensis TaxID=548579 RepID=A0A2A9EV26_9MICO|nr:hypothetical protein [Isoptericola jiangsuensis]PFG42406.1 hypothetical protein ATJ88_1067 [Isoptericola jiangsuensis]